MIDLHMHTNASDGTLEPDRLLDYAELMGFKAISITDHDTVAGIKQVINRESSVEVIPGIELDSEYKGMTVHILGYFIDVDNKELNDSLKMARQWRVDRGKRMIALLRDKGYDISLNDLKELGDSPIGRPHLAKILVDKGYFSKWSDVFEDLLKEGAPCYVERKRLSPKECIEIIKNAGGVPVLAHPGEIKAEFSRLPNILNSLVLMGLKGIEVQHPSNSWKVTRFLRKYCRENNLAMTAGSDFHGRPTMNSFMKGKLELLQELKKAKD